MPLPYANDSKVHKRANAEFVMHEAKHGQLHSGSKYGPLVKDHDQAVAIMLSETGQAKGRGNRKKS